MSKKAQQQRNLMATAVRRPATTEPASRPIPPRAKPVRITVDLSPELHRKLKGWAVDTEATIADVIRALATQMLEDRAHADAIRRLIHAEKVQ